jgi:hypothetical protein
MRLSCFILLSEEEKKEAVLHQGVLLAKRDSHDCKVFLFRLDNYFVETYCNSQNKLVEEYRVFGDTASLQPYLQAIALDGLLN